MAYADVCKSKKDQLFRCTICSNRFLQPKLLDCLHTFCCECLIIELEKSENSHVICCNLCGQETDLQNKDVNAIRPNKFLENITEIEEIVNSNCNYACSFCVIKSDKETIGEVRCLNCRKWLCSTCADRHAHLSRGHELVTLNNIREGDYFSKLRRIHSQCEEHGDNAQFYCYECNTSICQKCLDIKHNGHKISGITEAEEMTRKQLRKLEEECGKHSASISECETEANKKLQKITINEKQLLQNVRDLKTRMIKEIEKQAEIAETEIIGLFDVPKVSLRNCLKQYHDNKASFANTSLFSSELLQKGNSVEILQTLDIISNKYVNPDIKKFPTTEVPNITLSNSNSFSLSENLFHIAVHRNSNDIPEEKANVKITFGKKDCDGIQTLVPETSVTGFKTEPRPSVIEKRFAENRSEGNESITKLEQESTVTSGLRNTLLTTVKQTFPMQDKKTDNACIPVAIQTSDSHHVSDKKTDNALPTTVKQTFPMQDKKRDNACIPVTIQTSASHHLSDKKTDNAFIPVTIQTSNSHHVSIKIPSDKEKPSVYDICWVTDSEFAVGDRANKNIKIFRDDGTCCWFKSLHDSSVERVACVAGVVASDFAEGVHLDTEHTSFNKIYLPKREQPFVIAKSMDRKEVVVSNKSYAELRCYSTDGKRTKTISLPNRMNINYMCQRSNGDFLFTEISSPKLKALCNGQNPRILHKGIHGWQPQGIMTDAKDNIYVADFEGGDIWKFSASGQPVGILDIHQDGPRGLSISKQNRLIVNDSNANAWIIGLN